MKYLEQLAEINAKNLDLIKGTNKKIDITNKNRIWALFYNDTFGYFYFDLNFYFNHLDILNVDLNHDVFVLDSDSLTYIYSNIFIE